MKKREKMGNAVYWLLVTPVCRVGVALCGDPDNSTGLIRGLIDSRATTQGRPYADRYICSAKTRTTPLQSSPDGDASLSHLPVRSALLRRCRKGLHRRPAPRKRGRHCSGRLAADWAQTAREKPITDRRYNLNIKQHSARSVGQ